MPALSKAAVSYLTGTVPTAITAKLDLCKQLILQGKPIIEVYKLCGFGGYNHLFRAFKKEFGITPKEYYRQAKKSKVPLAP
ncbi:MAG TPA: helix-turn-helix transcriptional regulator [Epulopiscium sp.]|nr:helix-turn-helix transcriptional regulator [Candidatus Epulonipiscium sp.]